MINSTLWNRYKSNLCSCPEIGLSLDISRMKFNDVYFSNFESQIQKMFNSMTALEHGGIANPDEDRMVGHYWLRNSKLAPNAELRTEIENCLAKITAFTNSVHTGKIYAASGKPFTNILIIGIGGSALGPQFVADALATSSDPIKPWFLDNTDPDGIDRVISQIGDRLSQTLTIVISKSGSTKETRNGMLEAKAAYRKAGLDFSRHAVAITGNDSELDRVAKTEGWIERFPMWDWVGGRTSVLSAVGLLPAALQAVDIIAMLEGARKCDEITRCTDIRKNPAALMALMWNYATNGRGEKDMVLLPYKDRLLLFSRYLQQLLMESLGKELDLDGKVVCQGLSVYGNKGSTDQHAYVQQLREGVPNFFVTFIEVLQDREGTSMQVEDGITSGDFLFGFLQGTRKALYDNGRESMTISVNRIDAATIGALIALFERAVGFYATLININAYHQPGVEAGKKAATAVIALQIDVVSVLNGSSSALTADQVATAIKQPEEAETVYTILRHLAANPDRGIDVTTGKDVSEWTFRVKTT